jgi:HlyD family secretion protein
MRSVHRWLLVVALAGFAVVAWMRFRPREGSAAPKWQTAAVDRGRIVAKITATGTVSPLKTVQVGSQVSGRILELAADFNSTVSKGQVIARIDPQLFKATVERARANLAAARADQQRARALAQDAERQAERARSLAERKLVAQSEADTAASNAEAARAQVIAAGGSVQQATAALHEAELNLTYTTIYSPIDGVVISRSVDVGQTVAASFQAPTLFTIAEDLKKMQVDSSVSEGDVGRLKPGMKVTFTVDAYPGKNFPGVVRQIRNAPTTVQNVVTYDAVIDVDNPELELKPGMTANVTFLVGKKDDALRVPNAALRFRPPGQQEAGERGERGERGKTVYRLEKGKPVPVKVKTGLSDGTTTEIVEAELAPGDLVVTDTAGGASKPAAASGGGGGMRRGRPPGF